MSSDAKWELIILEVVHGFYLKLLRETLEDDVQVPYGLEAIPLNKPDELQQAAHNLRRWLKLLDLAITPEMVREALTANVDQDLAETLLRYFAAKKSHTDFDRDKTDFVITFLYRNPRVPGQWETSGYSIDGVAPMPPFEIAIMEILGDEEVSELTEEQSRLVEEFEYLRDEAEQARHFDELIDSGVLQKARRTKRNLGPAFYHPHALTAIARYNETFGRRFRELFASAAKEIKGYASLIQQRGGSLSARIDGDVTVQNLVEVEESAILKTEYRRAQDHFRQVSKLKKAIDARKRASRSTTGQVARPVPEIGSATSRPLGLQSEPISTAQAASPGSTPELSSAPVPTSQENSRIRSVEASIRGWIKAADDRSRLIVPMKFGNFVLTAPEADACAADYIQEKSFRGDNARAISRIVAIVARMTGEAEELKQRQNSNHLWRPHASALLVLLAEAETASTEAQRVMQLASDRGLVEKVKVLTAMLDKIRSRAEQVVALLAVVGVKAEWGLVGALQV